MNDKTLLRPGIAMSLALFTALSLPMQAAAASSCDGIEAEANAAERFEMFFVSMLRVCRAAEWERTTTESPAIRAADIAVLEKFAAYRGVTAPDETRMNEVSRYLIADAIGVQDSMRDWILAHRKAELEVTCDTRATDEDAARGCPPG